MMTLACKVVKALGDRTVATAESCTGGMIGGLLTAVPGASRVFKGGVISYTNEIKNRLLGVDGELLETCGAVSAPVAEAMARGARAALGTDLAVSVTGLAGPGGDEYGNPVGTVFVGFADKKTVRAEEYHFAGDREAVRQQAVRAALEGILRMCKDFKED